MTLHRFDPDTPTPSSKAGSDYLAHLAGLHYGRGWVFWGLAGSAGRSSPSTEWVWLIRKSQLREACIDVTTGAIVRWGECV